MKSFNLYRKSNLSRDTLFNISTDVKNFHNVMPNYFKSLTVLSSNSSEKIVLEKISFLGKTLEVKTKHIILSPNIHKIFILSGPLRGTSFIEKYVSLINGTGIAISINLQINGILKFIPLLDVLLMRRMNHVLNEFVDCAENYSKRIPT
ncbi:MAG: hypothetical protein K5777_02490 [Nitrosopumilus sp.]|nr:hypothetical protein [Nitrosopumilus sp.]